MHNKFSLTTLQISVPGRVKEKWKSSYHRGSLGWEGSLGIVVERKEHWQKIGVWSLHTWSSIINKFVIHSF